MHKNEWIIFKSVNFRALRQMTMNFVVTNFKSIENDIQNCNLYDIRLNEFKC